MIITHEETTVRQFIKRSEDIDIYDDVCEELGIAFCGPMGLIEEGEKRFAEILDLKVDIYTDRDGYKNAVLRIDDESSKVRKRRLRIAKEFLKEWQVIVAKKTMRNGSSKLMNKFQLPGMSINCPVTL